MASMLCSACVSDNATSATPVPESVGARPTLVFADCYEDPDEGLHIFMDVVNSALDLGPSTWIGAGGTVRGLYEDGSTEILVAMAALEDPTHDLVLSVADNGERPDSLAVYRPAFMVAAPGSLSAPSLAQLKGVSESVLDSGFEVARVRSSRDATGLLLNFSDAAMEEGWHVVGIENAAIHVGSKVLTKWEERIPPDTAEQWLVFESRSTLPSDWRDRPVTLTFDGPIVMLQGTVEVPIPSTCIGSS